MGCSYSACWPSRGSGDGQGSDFPASSTVLGELGHWKERVRQLKNLDDHGAQYHRTKRSKSSTSHSQEQSRQASSDVCETSSSFSSHKESRKRSLNSLNGLYSLFGFRKQLFEAKAEAAKSEIRAFANAHNVEVPASKSASPIEIIGLERRNSAPNAAKASVAKLRKKRAQALARRATEPVDDTDCCYLTRLLNPPFEIHRQATLDMLGITHGETNEPLYVGTVDLAAKIFKVPFAALLFFDKAQVWYKAIHSSFPNAENTKWAWLPRHMVLSSQILLLDKQRVMVVEDVMQDPRFLDLIINRMGLGQPYKFPETCFLGAAPLLAPNGYIMGVLEIQDSVPRKLDAGAFNLLINLAEMTARSILKDIVGFDYSALPPNVSDLEVGASAKILSVSSPGTQHSERKDQIKPRLTVMGRKGSYLDKPILLCSADTDFREGEVLYVNANFEQMTSISAEKLTGQKIKEILDFKEYHPEQFEMVRTPFGGAANHMNAKATFNSSPGTTFSVEIKSAKAENLDEYMPGVGVPNFIELSEVREHYRYFFVFIRALERTNGVSSMVPRLPNPFACHVPTLAFAAVADDEQWMPRESMNSQTQNSEPSSENRTHQYSDRSSEERRRQSSEDSATNTSSEKGKQLASKSSVQLPHNIEIFDEVTLGPLLGRGSFGRVHRGFWKGHLVAVKILETFKRGSMDVNEIEDIAEARLVEEMKHPNIVRTFNHGTRIKHFSGHPSNSWSNSGSKGSNRSVRQTTSSGFVLETWLLLEYCNKGSLQDAISRGWFLSDPLEKTSKPCLRTIVAVAMEIARGITYLHSKQVLHSDLTPGNVLLKEAAALPHKFTVKIADFGLSRPTSSRTISTQTYGTVTHMPPELLSDGRLTKAADVYAFGVLLWSMMTGEAAWAGLRRTQVIFKVTTLKLALPTPKDCPPCFKELLDSCMHKNYRRRPAMSEIAEVLDGFLELIDNGTDLAEVQCKMKADESNLASYGSTLLDVDEEAPMSTESLQANIGLPSVSVDSTNRSLSGSPKAPKSPRAKDQSLISSIPPSPSKSNSSKSLDVPANIPLEVL